MIGIKKSVSKDKNLYMVSLKPNCSGERDSKVEEKKPRLNPPETKTRVNSKNEPNVIEDKIHALKLDLRDLSRKYVIARFSKKDVIKRIQLN